MTTGFQLTQQTAVSSKSALKRDTGWLRKSEAVFFFAKISTKVTPLLARDNEVWVLIVSLIADSCPA